MTKNLQDFMAAVSNDKELIEKINQESDLKVIIAIARDMGFELTEADFAGEPEELSEAELDAVAGGTPVSCACVLGGGGTKDHNDKTCACVAAGFGYTKSGKRRCFCAAGGCGYNY